MMTAMVIAVRPSGLDRIEGEGRSARAGSIGLVPEAMVMAVSPSGLDRIEGDSRFARAGSRGLAPEDVNIDVNGRSARARSIGLRIR